MIKINGFHVYLLFSFLLFFKIANAAEIEVACEGCGETEYKQAAIIAAPPAGGTVVVFDIKNGNLRRFAVIMIEEFDGGPIGWLAESMTPSQENLDYFYSLDQVKNKVGSSIQIFCGAGHGFGEFIVPDLNISVDVLACLQHDECYEQGGGESDREACDEDFLNALRLTTNPVAAAFYYHMVSLFGTWSFNYWPNTGGLWCIFEECEQYLDFSLSY